MFHYFRNIRLRLATENNLAKYLRYAFGEIVLVMIGILLALQVNNWNISRINRNTELRYLRNIRVDLSKDLDNLRFNIDYREKRYESAKKIIDQINGSPVEDLSELSFNILNTLWEEKFQPNNVTYKEMLSSGNLNLIHNQSIKQLLLELEALYQTNAFYIEHESFDYREYVSKPLFRMVDLEQLKPVFLGEKTAAEQKITLESLKPVLNDPQYKNGCMILYWSAEGVMKLFQEIEAKSHQAIELIDREL